MALVNWDGLALLGLSIYILLVVSTYMYFFLGNLDVVGPTEALREGRMVKKF